MGQSWAQLLFAHWRVPAEALRRTVPEGVPLDERDGSAWLGITPFVVRGLRARGLPPAPFAGRFAELNVRTYTTIDGRPGIYFLSPRRRQPPGVAAPDACTACRTSTRA
jgi:uncharacterized protein YqjF (DUF2071 family)